VCSDCLALRDDPSAFEVANPYKYFQNFMKLIGINIYIDLQSQKLMGHLSTLSNLSTWCQVIFKIQKCLQLVEATLLWRSMQDLYVALGNIVYTMVLYGHSSAQYT
jgi:hypothetical protein